MHGRRQQCRQSAAADREQRCPRRTDGVEHRDDVVDHQFDAGGDARRRRIGEPDPRGSNRMNRLNEARRSSNRRTCGSSSRMSTEITLP
jgi:hypothetical protein